MLVVEVQVLKSRQILQRCRQVTIHVIVVKVQSDEVAQVPEGPEFSQIAIQPIILHADGAQRPD